MARRSSWASGMCQYRSRWSSGQASLKRSRCARTSPSTRCSSSRRCVAVRRVGARWHRGGGGGSHRHAVTPSHGGARMNETARPWQPGRAPRSAADSRPSAAPRRVARGRASRRCGGPTSERHRPGAGIAPAGSRHSPPSAPAASAPTPAAARRRWRRAPRPPRRDQSRPAGACIGARVTGFRCGDVGSPGRAAVPAAPRRGRVQPRRRLFEHRRDGGLSGRGAGPVVRRPIERPVEPQPRHGQAAEQGIERHAVRGGQPGQAAVEHGAAEQVEAGASGRLALVGRRRGSLDERTRSVLRWRLASVARRRRDAVARRGSRPATSARDPPARRAGGVGADRTCRIHSPTAAARAARRVDTGTASSPGAARRR